MSKRHDDALFIQDGACNPLAIANTMLAAMHEVRAEGGGSEAMARDPAVRLMLHQLCHLARLHTVDWNTNTECFDYTRETDACQTLAQLHPSSNTKAGV